MSDVSIGIAHRLHLVICNGLSLWISNQEQYVSRATDATSGTDVNLDESAGDDDLMDTMASALPSSSSTDEQEPLDIVGNVMQCEEDFSDDETLDDEEHDPGLMDIDDNWSLDVREDFDPSADEIEQQLIGSVMKKCRSFIKLVNKSSILKDYIKKSKKKFRIRRSLQLDIKNRWNSTHRLIETRLIYKKLISKLTSEKNEIGLTYQQTKNLSSIEIDQSDWKMLESLEFVLKPFSQATKLLSGSEYSTIAIGVFAIIQLRDFLEDSKPLNTSESKFIHRFKHSLLKSFVRYFDDDEQWAEMKRYAFFDPLGYGCLSRRDKRTNEMELSDLHLRTVQSRADDNESQTSGRAQCATSQTQSRQSSTQPSIKYFFLEIGKPHNSTNSFSTAAAHVFNEELVSDRSVAQKEYNSIVDGSKRSDVMEFWRTNQSVLVRLSQMAMSHLFTSATSVPSESAFSTASYLLQKQRSRLSLINLANSVFLKGKIDVYSTVLFYSIGITLHFFVAIEH